MLQHDGLRTDAGRFARLTLALALVAFGLFGPSSGAQAQQCVDGYQMVKGEIPVACGARTAPSSREPVHTGSIEGRVAGGNADEIPGTAPASHMNGMKCFGGYAYRPTANESYITMPMRCN